MIDTRALVESNVLTSSASSRRYGRLRLRIDPPVTAAPGQFVMLKPRDHYEPLLRRAMAYYRVESDADGLHAEFIYQVLGRGTESLARLRPGDTVDFLGSLGNSFDIVAATGHEALLVAGGAGSPALYMLAEELLRRDIPTQLFLGGASQGDLCGLDDFTALLGAERVTTATMDGSHGEAGFVTRPLEAYLARRRHPVMLFACGPDPMLHRVAQIAAQTGAPAQLSLEAPMACGFGICVGCAVAVKDSCPEGFVFKKVCTDGPVFWSRDLAW